MKDKGRKLKEIEGSKLRTLRKIGKPQTYADGSIRIPVRWQIETEPLNLGSINNPKNTDILKIEFTAPSGENIGNIMGKFFKGF